MVRCPGFKRRESAVCYKFCGHGKSASCRVLGTTWLVSYLLLTAQFIHSQLIRVSHCMFAYVGLITQIYSHGISVGSFRDVPASSGIGLLRLSLCHHIAAMLDEHKMARTVCLPLLLVWDVDASLAKWTCGFSAHCRMGHMSHLAPFEWLVSF